jgi:hypothetical protein
MPFNHAKTGALTRSGPAPVRRRLSSARNAADVLVVVPRTAEAAPVAGTAAGCVMEVGR